MQTVTIKMNKDINKIKPGQVIEFEIGENTLRELLLNMTNDTSLDVFLSSYGSFEAAYIYEEAKRSDSILSQSIKELI